MKYLVHFIRCNECGEIFAWPDNDPKCPRCGGYGEEIRKEHISEDGITWEEKPCVHFRDGECIAPIPACVYMRGPVGGINRACPTNLEPAEWCQSRQEKKVFYCLRRESKFDECTAMIWRRADMEGQFGIGRDSDPISAIHKAMKNLYSKEDEAKR